jgi:pimeloyl-ACP methyl ester carboxylesterase
MPETRYASAGGVNVAYQVVGDGAHDLVYVPGWISNIELMWDDPGLARFLRGLASIGRLIVFDKRGSGLSDPVAVDDLPGLEERMDDLRAVMDAAGSQRATLFGHSEGGNLCMLFAATHPDRTDRLIMTGSPARRIRTDDYPWAPTVEERESLIDQVEREWGRTDWVEDLAPTRVDDVAFRSWWKRYSRMSASPRAAAALLRMNSQIDVRALLPSISVPTLLLYRIGDRDVLVEEGRYLAERIAGATLVELEGDDHLFWVADSEPMLQEIEEFVTGRRGGGDTERRLATILFTDIVGSTEAATALGDRKWRELLERHNRLVREELARWRGVEVNTAGDGFLSTFDGPARAIRCARAISASVAQLGIDVRCGVHTGEIEIVGDDVAGLAVHIGARIAALAGAREVLVSRTVKDLVVGAGFGFADRGLHELKGIPDEWQVYAVD